MIADGRIFEDLYGQLSVFKIGIKHASYVSSCSIVEVQIHIILSRDEVTVCKLSLSISKLYIPVPIKCI